MKKDFYPFNHKDCLMVRMNKAVVLVHYGDDFLSLLEGKKKTGLNGHLCGYVVLAKEQMPAELHCNGDNYLSFINVPGGITYVAPVLNTPEMRRILDD